MRTLLCAGSVVVLLLLASPTAAAPAPATAGAAAHFEVVIDGTPLGSFHSASGLGSQTEVSEYRSGSDPSVVLKVPGQSSALDVTLKRGVTRDVAFAVWQEIAAAQIEGYRRNGSIIMVNQNGTEVARWNFTNAWPKKVEVTLDEEAGIVLEEVTITAESIQRVAP